MDRPWIVGQAKSHGPLNLEIYESRASGVSIVVNRRFLEFVEFPMSHEEYGRRVTK